jgi:hypothetical protein
VLRQNEIDMFGKRRGNKWAEEVGELGMSPVDDLTPWLGETLDLFRPEDVRTTRQRRLDRGF